MTEGITHSTGQTLAIRRRAILATAKNISWNRAPLVDSILQRSFGDIANMPLPPDMLALLALIAGEPNSALPV